jgi:hypothetical protein
MFELKLNNNTIKLKWGTWSMREFCIEKGITIDKYFDILSNTHYDLDVLIKLVHIGYKSACVSNKEEIIYNENDACDWIDELGSIFVSDGPLVDYVKYVVNTTVTSVQGKPKEEKKKSNKAKMG